MGETIAIPVGKPIADTTKLVEQFLDAVQTDGAIIGYTHTVHEDGAVSYGIGAATHTESGRRCFYDLAQIDVSGLSDGSRLVTLLPLFRAYNSQTLVDKGHETYRALLAEFRPAAHQWQRGAANVVNAKPQAPAKPTGRELYDWFSYYHACKKAGIKYRLKDIANETGYTYGYVREQHRLYKLDRQIE